MLHHPGWLRQSVLIQPAVLGQFVDSLWTVLQAVLQAVFRQFVNSFAGSFAGSFAAGFDACVEGCLAVIYEEI